MKAKKLKTKLARLLMVTTIVTSTGFSSLAQVTSAGDVFGEKGEGYRLITLHADESSEFGNPLKFEAVAVGTSSNATSSDATATPSDSSPSGRLVAVGKSGKVTTFAVGGEEAPDVENGMVGSLEKNVLDEAVQEAQLRSLLNQGEDNTKYIWLTQEGNLDTEIKWESGYFDLPASETHLYAATVVTMTSPVLEDKQISAVGLPQGAKLVVEAVADSAKKTADDLGQVLSKEGYQGLDESSIFQLEINLGGKQPAAGKPVTVQVELPDVLAEAKNGGKEIVVIHFHGNEAGSLIEVKEVEGEEGLIQFDVDKFSIFVLAAVDGQDGPDTPDNPDDPDNPDNPDNPRPVRPGGGSGSGGSSSGGGRSYSNPNADTMVGAWQKDSRGWRFLQAQGSYAANSWGRINGSWYYFGADTYAMTGWVYVDGQWYYLNPEQGDNQCKMVAGWIFDETYQKWFYTNDSGAMASGWQQVDGKWYYLNPVSDGTKGAMAASQWVDGYYVGDDGVWVASMSQ